MVAGGVAGASSGALSDAVEVSGTFGDLGAELPGVVLRTRRANSKGVAGSGHGWAPRRSRALSPGDGCGGTRTYTGTWRSRRSCSSAPAQVPPCFNPVATTRAESDRA